MHYTVQITGFEKPHTKAGARNLDINRTKKLHWLLSVPREKKIIGAYKILLSKSHL